MAEDWTAAAADIAEGISEAGTAASIIRDGVTTGPDYDPVIGPPITAACKVVYDEWKKSEVDGTLIRRGDRKVLMASSGFSIAADNDGNFLNEPSTADAFKDGQTGKQYAIVNVSQLAPAGVVLMWELQLRA